MSNVFDSLRKDFVYKVLDTFDFVEKIKSQADRIIVGFGVLGTHLILDDVVLIRFNLTLPNLTLGEKSEYGFVINETLRKAFPKDYANEDIKEIESRHNRIIAMYEEYRFEKASLLKAVELELREYLDKMNEGEVVIKPTETSAVITVDGKDLLYFTVYKNVHHECMVNLKSIASDATNFTDDTHVLFTTEQRDKLCTLYLRYHLLNYSDPYVSIYGFIVRKLEFLLVEDAKPLEGIHNVRL